MKRWYIALISAIVVAFVIGQACKFSFPGEGLSDLSAQEDALGRGFGVEYVMGSETSRSFRDDPGQYDNLANDALIIAIGKPTGKIVQSGMYFGQEVTVDRIVKGADELKDDEGDGGTETFYVFSPDGFRMHEDNRVRYSGGYGLMQKDSSYLLFLESASYTSLMPVGGYGLLGWFFGYIKLDGDDTRSQPVSKPTEELTYDEVWQLEYIAESEEVLESVYRMKERIMASVL
jgi:hypothetical protein